MNSPLRFHRLVATDVRKSVRWYTDISDELGASFREILDATFDNIERHPANFSFAFENVRFAKMKRFPYIVLFELLDDAPFVLGVFHGSSNPEKWRRRAKI
jgi:hypothetical protein